MAFVGTYLVPTNIDPPSISEGGTPSAECVCTYIHGTDLVVGDGVLRRPGWMATDVERVVLGFIDDIDLWDAAEKG